MRINADFVVKSLTLAGTLAGVIVVTARDTSTTESKITFWTIYFLFVVVLVYVAFPIYSGPATGALRSVRKWIFWRHAHTEFPIG